MGENITCMLCPKPTNETIYVILRQKIGIVTLGSKEVTSSFFYNIHTYMYLILTAQLSKIQDYLSYADLSTKIGV